MKSQSATRSQAELFYQRLGILFLAVFVINSLFGILPLRPADSRWQIALADVLKNTAPLALIGVALICLVPFVRTGKLDGNDYPLQRRILKLAPFAGYGFLLLIPLQMRATWVQVRDADAGHQRTLRAIERRLNEFRSATSNEQLQQLTRGMPDVLQPQPDLDVARNRQQLLSRFEPRLEAVRTQTRTRKRQVIEKEIRKVLNDSLISAAYGLGFLCLRRVSPAAKQGTSPAQPSVWAKLRRKLAKRGKGKVRTRRMP
jgi:hypothetical protein